MNPDQSGCSFLVATSPNEPVLTPECVTDDQRLIARTAREFVDGSVRPRLAEIERLDLDLTAKLLREAGDLGLLGIDAGRLWRAGT